MIGSVPAAAAATTLIKAPAAEQMAAMVNKGDGAWMLVSALLVLMMSVPGLALFYAGLVRSKRGVGGGYVLARSPAEIALSTLAGLLADRGGRPGGFPQTKAAAEG